MSGSGFVLRGYTTPTAWDTYDTVLMALQAGNNGAFGVLWDTDAADGHLIGTVLWDNLDNVGIRSSSQQITTCHFYNAVRDNVRFLGGGPRTKIFNCKIEGSGEHAVNIDSTDGGYSDIQIGNNGFSTNGDSAHNTYDHIYAGGPSGNGISRVQIVGNSFGHRTPSPRIRRATG